MLSTSARIVEVDDLLSVLVEGAARSEQRDEGGPRYVVEKVEPAKPSTSQRVEHVRFQVQKTYCLSIRAGDQASVTRLIGEIMCFQIWCRLQVKGTVSSWLQCQKAGEIGAGGIMGLQQSRRREPEV